MMIESRLAALERRSERSRPPLTVIFEGGRKRACNAVDAVMLALDGNTVDRVQSERGGNGKLSDLLTAIARL